MPRRVPRERSSCLGGRSPVVIDELEVTGTHTAYALTRSNGTHTVLATGDETAESNREIFLFRHTETDWKIARYMFNKPA